LPQGEEALPGSADPVFIHCGQAPLVTRPREA
jgi:hypothetical protein